MKDKFGNPLAVGDFVVCGDRSGNSGELQLAVVVRVEDGALYTLGTDKWSGKPNTKLGKRTDTDRVAYYPFALIPVAARETLRAAGREFVK